MSLKELKKCIKARIDQSTDIELLESVLAFLNENEKPFIISEHFKSEIEQGRRDIENGDFITLEELEEKYKEYLKD